jgi:outer membrane protein assembly factor BamB
MPAGQLPAKWSVGIGPGYSGPTVAAGRVYVTDRGQGERDLSAPESEVERVLCFDVADGKLIWQHDYDAPYTISYKAGPRACVTIDSGKALSVGAMGHFHCLNAETGQVIWARDLNNELKIEMPIWGITAAPLVYRDMVIQIASGEGHSCVVALDLETGKTRWTALDEKAGYSSPVVVRQGDQDVVVCWTGESVSGLDPLDGHLFWSIPMQSRNMPIGVPTPVIQDDLLFVSSFYDGSMLIRLDLTMPSAEKVWHRVGEDEQKTDALHCMISNPIIKGQYIYGVDSYGELRCLKLDDGDRVWEDKSAVKRNRWATIHVIQAGNREIMVNEQGELLFGTLSPTGLQLHSRSELISPTRIQLNRRDGVVWAPPAISDGHIFVRNDYELRCVSLLADPRSKPDSRTKP